MNGIIILNKPAAFTSFDAVAKLRGILGERRIGHAGTLDPQATGVLVVLVGNATRLSGILPQDDKVYEAECVFGIETDTEDIWGTVLSEENVRNYAKKKAISKWAKQAEKFKRNNNSWG